MGRRKIPRVIRKMPHVVFYKPQGIPMMDLTTVELSVDELEALQLIDAEGLLQEEAAAQMGVSRPTLGRILAGARKTVATALSQGCAIRVEGGDYTFEADVQGKRKAGQPCCSGGKQTER
ncbi:DUF134 domain-containing protein [Halodesulfovibrio spirochaetisodalis]|uniref:UPF0251 protein SP90_07640 n=1 Tax=Halodesulfovibrio spirochaetisodalis TaxID=1560234 RepID=A0A1B7XE57_9BACT|nr:DUF134 domain-containing protein [Halodesulfovibrio spirochaetisodalis]OBQ52434.1 hypothetical protein SP90_07640 [Halodesulfovibrio spirochaetisodalis]